MALTPSTMLALGTSAPEFQLPDTVSGNAVSLDSFADKKGLLVMFICNHCPFVKHINDGLVSLGRDYADSDLGIVAINSNDVETHPDDSPDNMKANAEELGYVFPYCYDETQSVAKTYAAACTPDFFLFDGASQARLSRSARRQSTRKRRRGHRKRLARRHQRRTGGVNGFSGPAAQRRLQHQVESRQRTPLLEPLSH